MKYLAKVLTFVAYYEMFVDLVNAIQNAKAGKPFTWSGSYKAKGKRVNVKAVGSVEDE